jgi:hypothetical protein
MSQLTIKQAKTVLPIYLDAKISVELQSSPGQAKSEGVAQLVAELSARDGFEWGFQTLMLATQTPNDLLGFMTPQRKQIDGQEYYVSDYTMPPWMLTNKGKPVSAHKRGILFLDEYGQGEPDVKRASAELLLNRRLGPWALPDGWSVIAASNRSTDRSGVTKAFDFVINRRALIDIVPDLDGWTEWAVTAEVMPLTIAFANSNPHIVFSGEVPEKQGPWCTPRSLVMADRLLQRMAQDGALADTPIANAMVTGLIGPAAAAQYFSFVRLEQEMPKFETIVANPDGVKVPDRPDAQMLICYNLAHRVDEDTAGPVATYLDRFPKEFGVTFIKAATQRNYKLLSTPAFRKWCSENASLISAVR